MFKPSAFSTRTLPFLGETLCVKMQWIPPWNPILPLGECFFWVNVDGTVLNLYTGSGYRPDLIIVEMFTINTCEWLSVVINEKQFKRLKIPLKRKKELISKYL